MEKEHGDVIIDGRHYLRVSLTAVAGLVGSVALVFFGQVISIRDELDNRDIILRQLIDNKADRRETLDRYTRTQHDIYAKGVRDWAEAEHKRLEAGACR